jgi:inhibitor of cysteine peptidase
MRLWLPIVCMLAVPFAACGASEEARLVTEADNGTTVELGLGERLTVRLESNPTTGFSWQLEVEPNGAFLRSAGHEYVPPDDGLVGQGGIELWTFEGVAPGTTRIALVYLRPFDPSDVGANFEVEVRVR